VKANAGKANSQVRALTGQLGTVLKSSRVIHVLTGAVALLALLGTKFTTPELWHDTVTIFATVGGFFTIYGVAFTIIETWRARSASEQARAAVERASRSIANLHGVKGIAECQTCIRAVLEDLGKVGWASTAALSRIIELYTAEFHEAYANPVSDERGLVLALQSHAASAPGPLKGKALARLKNTLITMLADLTAAASGKLSE